MKMLHLRTFTEFLKNSKKGTENQKWYIKPEMTYKKQNGKWQRYRYINNNIKQSNQMAEIQQNALCRRQYWVKNI